ncbi:SDR family oxidoreductase [Sporosarcina sp. A2]|uniref:SDR family oxidoreductase n=1 Tax=Sporosarcina sp. A2 TaxID=3393449 RepID=UPI003D7987F6
MVKVLVVGANGQIGKTLVSLIQKSDSLEAKAMIRKQEQASYFEDLGAETVLVDLEDDTKKIAEAAEGMDAIVFAAGSGPKTGPDKTILIDLDGAVKTIEAAKQANVKRFVLISSYDTTREEIQRASSDFAPYVAAKHYADEWLRGTDLDYTIVHPGALTNDKATGKIEAAKKVEAKEVPRDDIAHVLLACLENTSTIGKEFQVIAGDTSVKEAIASLK